jgi:hypothetical protein
MATAAMLIIVHREHELEASRDARFSKEQPSFSPRRVSAAAQIRPYRQRGGRRPGARRLLHSSRSSRLGLRSCWSSGARPAPGLADARLRRERRSEPRVREMTVAVPEWARSRGGAMSQMVTAFTSAQLALDGLARG